MPWWRSRARSPPRPTSRTATRPVAASTSRSPDRSGPASATPTTGRSGTPASGRSWPTAGHSATITEWASTGLGSCARRWGRRSTYWSRPRARSTRGASSIPGSWGCRPRSAASRVGEGHMTERDGSILVIDVGTSGVRGAIVRPDATMGAVHYRQVLPSSPAPGLVQFDASAMADAALHVARAALAEGEPVVAVGVSNQRASTVVWERATGEPVGPGLGWQDLRTVGACLVWQAEGLRFAPNESATKLAYLLDEADPGRTRDLCFGTVDTWIAWHLSAGELHVTDLSNAAVTGLVRGDASAWDQTILEHLRVPESVLPALVDTSGIIGTAGALPGAPSLAALVGDQQASLVGQGCVRPGLAKITFGTGGMLDVCVGPDRPAFERQGKQGTFPIVAWRRGGQLMWGVEAVMLAAGTNVEWLRDDLGLITTAEESHDVA